MAEHTNNTRQHGYGDPMQAFADVAMSGTGPLPSSTNDLRSNADGLSFLLLAAQHPHSKEEDAITLPHTSTTLAHEATHPALSNVSVAQFRSSADVMQGLQRQRTIEAWTRLLRLLSCTPSHDDQQVVDLLTAIIKTQSECSNALKIGSAANDLTVLELAQASEWATQCFLEGIHHSSHFFSM